MPQTLSVGETTGLAEEIVYVLGVKDITSYTKDGKGDVQNGVVKGLGFIDVFISLHGGYNDNTACLAGLSNRR